MMYRSRSDGRYPIGIDEVRRLSGLLFGDGPTDDVLNAAGVDPVTATPPPTPNESQTIREGEPVQRNGKWVQTWLVETLPPVHYFTYKGDIWRRVTDAEAKELDEDLTALPVRLRRLWDDSSQINHDDEYGQLLVQTMTERWGAARAGEVMAPSGVVT